MFSQPELNLRQQRWLELISDYDLEISYHEGRANVVADALSRKSNHSVATLITSEELSKEFERMNLEIIKKGELEAKLGALSIQPTFFEEIMIKQMDDPKLIKLREQASEGKAEGFTIHEDGSLRFKGRWCVPEGCDSLKDTLLNEAHSSRYSVHPGGDKMYQDLKGMFWWSGMKKNIAEFDSKCLTCQKVKSEHLRPAGLLQRLEVPVWK